MEKEIYPGYDSQYTYSMWIVCILEQVDFCQKLICSNLSSSMPRGHIILCVNKQYDAKRDEIRFEAE